MCCKNIISKIAVLVLAFAIGLLAAGWFQKPIKEINALEVAKPTDHNKGGSGSSGPGDCGSGCPFNEELNEKFPYVKQDITPLKVLSKPKAVYTDIARSNQTEGSVRLRVRLLASGKVGDIAVVKGLPDGLTEQAIEAAKQVKFEPKMIEGKAVDASVVIEYHFDIY